MAQLHPVLSFYAGDTWEILACLHYADGTPFSLAAGAAVTWTLSRDGAELFSLALGTPSGNGSSLAVSDSGDPVPYQCLITVTPADSTAFAAGDYQDRIVAIDPSGFRSTQCIGTVKVRT